MGSHFSKLVISKRSEIFPFVKFWQKQNCLFVCLFVVYRRVGHQFVSSDLGSWSQPLPEPAVLLDGHWLVAAAWETQKLSGWTSDCMARAPPLGASCHVEDTLCSKSSFRSGRQSEHMNF